MSDAPKPVRLQLSRKKGFSLQDASWSLNGLQAVSVARPGKWGNQFLIADFGQKGAVRQYRRWVDGFVMYASQLEGRDELLAAAVVELYGKNLACWCKPGDPCHADILLEIANG
jgi:uncharacterized protein DUF4326